MEMSVFMAFVLACVTGFAYLGRRFLGDMFLERPVFLAPVVGFIMGDLQTGLVVGGTLELIFMGAASYGGSVPANVAVGSTIGTAFAITSGATPEEALVIAVPAAMLGAFLEMFAKSACVFCVTFAEKYADEADTRGISRMLHIGNLFHFLSFAIPTFIALALGADYVGTMVAGIPPWLNSGVQVAGKILPALGFGILLSTLSSKVYMPFFFIGFLFAAYTSFGVLGIAVLAILVSMVIMNLSRDEDEDEEFDEETAAAPVSISKKDQWRFIFRGCAIQSAFSFDRMQAIGFTWTLIPYLKEIYKDNKDGLREALKRHLSFFNVMPWMVGPVVAVTANMEARKARGEDIDGHAIQGVKSGLMGPLAGIGDSLFIGTFRPILGGICAGLAFQGLYLAPIIFVVVANVVHFYVRYITLVKGIELGERAFTALTSSGFRKIMQGATITGLMAVGALVGTWLNVKTPLAMTIRDATIKLQSSLDSIMPKLLPLCITLCVYYMIRKGVKNTNIMLILTVAGLILGAFGILG